jgi:DNA-binding response OmpR family regulator
VRSDTQAAEKAGKMITKPVVVIEDDPATIDLIAEVLDDEGFATLRYPDWLVSGTIIADVQPELLILELRHDDPSKGLLLLEELRQCPATRAIPAIVSSTDQCLLQHLAEPLRRLGCVILAKPFDLDEFLSKIDVCQECRHEVGLDC